MPDFIPRSDNGCLAWSASYAGRIGADPAMFGISAADAALLASLQADFAQKLQLAQSPGTRTPVGIAAKDAARAAMQRVARRVANRARGVLMQNRAALVGLGLCIGKGRSAKRSRIAPPQSRPSVFVKDVRGSSVSIVLRDADALSRRGKAHGISGAILFTCVGDVPPTDRAQWRMHKMTSRTDATLDFGARHPPGTMIWICAQWMGSPSQCSPVSAPISTYLNYPNLTRAAA